MNTLTNFFTELMRKYLPDPFVFAIGLTILTMSLAIVVEQQSLVTTIDNWGAGFWNLLGFTTQMAVILVMGYVLARAPLVDALLSGLTSRVQRPATAMVVATLVGAVASYINWGFGLVVGGILARKLAAKLRGVHYPLIIASAYSGFTLYGIGLSATIPIVISAKGHALAGSMGVIPLSQTIFSTPMLVAGLVLLVTLPLLNVLMLPRRPEGWFLFTRVWRRKSKAVTVRPTLQHAQRSRLHSASTTAGCSASSLAWLLPSICIDTLPQASRLTSTSSTSSFCSRASCCSARRHATWKCSTKA